MADAVETVEISEESARQIIRAADLRGGVETEIAEFVFKTYQYLLRERAAVSCNVNFGSTSRNRIARELIERGAKAERLLAELAES